MRCQGAGHGNSIGNTVCGDRSDPGIIVTGDNAKIIALQQKLSPRDSERIVYGDIPRRPPAFQPRDDLRDRLLNAGQLAIISTLTGTRGIGKSNLQPPMPGNASMMDGHWLPGLQPSTLVRSCQTLINSQESWACARTAMTLCLLPSGYAVGWRPHAASDILIVFDNSSNPDSLTDWLPSTGSAGILITSNRR